MVEKKTKAVKSAGKKDVVKKTSRAKSTPKESAAVKSASMKQNVKKAATTKPKSAVRQAASPTKAQEINWNITGFASAAITLLGGSLLFMLGWAYEANWYGYFGISMTQIKVQPQDVLIQSIPGVVTLVSCLAAAVISYTLLYSLYQFIIEVKKRREVKEIPANPFKNTSAPVVSFSLIDWFWVFTLAEFFLAAVLYWVYLPTVERKIGNLSNLLNIYELNYLPFLFLVVVTISLLSMALFGIVFVSTTTYLTIYLKIRSWFKPKMKVIIDNPREIKAPPLYLGLIAMIFLILLTSVTLSAVYSVNDASSGIHTGAWKIQEVLIVSSNNNPFQQMGMSYCYDDYCASVPYGLIGENDNAYILIRWQKTEDGYFPYNPGVILLPRSDDIILVPRNYGQ